MNKKQMQGLGVIVLIFALGAIIWFFRTKSPQTTDSTQSNQPTEQTPAGTTTIGGHTTTSAQTWTGTLKTSDNSSKGSLMLLTKDYTIYIRTSRDYSALLGKTVSVSYKGTVNNFTLQDIVAK